VAPEVGRVQRHDDDVTHPGLDGPVAARADIATPSLVRLHPSNLDAVLVPDHEVSATGPFFREHACVAGELTDDKGRAVWLVSWGHLYRSDWIE
jgi:hypothetical protein